MYEDQAVVDERHGRGEIDPMREYILNDTGTHLRLYRLVHSAPPSVNDFLSARDLYLRHPMGRRSPPSDPRLFRIWDGISMSARPEHAAMLRERFPRLGSFIAVMDLLVVRFRVERSTDTPGHLTVWGDADEFLRYVREVLRLA